MSDNRESFERFFPAMLTGDRETLRQLFTDDIAWHTPPSSPSHGIPEERKGREQVVKFLCDMGATLYEPGSFQLQPEVQAVEGDQAVMFGWLSARTAKGADYRNLYAFAFRFRDGRICGGPPVSVAPPATPAGGLLCARRRSALETVGIPLGWGCEGPLSMCGGRGA